LIVVIILIYLIFALSCYLPHPVQLSKMVFKRTARMSTGGKVACHQLAPRVARCSTATLTITLTVPCISSAPGGDPSSGSNGDSDISNNLESASNRGNNHDGSSNNSSNDLRRGPGGTPRTQQMTVATTEAVVQPIVAKLKMLSFLSLFSVLAELVFGSLFCLELIKC
jgi:hypothetical protein